MSDSHENHDLAGANRSAWDALRGGLVDRLSTNRMCRPVVGGSFTRTEPMVFTRTELMVLVDSLVEAERKMLADLTEDERNLLEDMAEAHQKMLDEMVRDSRERMAKAHCIMRRIEMLAMGGRGTGTFGATECDAMPDERG